jgi:hypothetical protein
MSVHVKALGTEMRRFLKIILIEDCFYSGFVGTSRQRRFGVGRRRELEKRKRA